ncbi:MAG TPA: M23 family metallopeptidase [Thermoanaerobaculia bacterium]
MKKLFAGAIFLFALPLAADVTVRALPATPLIERTQNAQALSFDLLVENTTGDTLELSRLEATVLGKDDTLIVQRRLQRNGGSISTLPNREVKPGARYVVFNPFHEFEPDVELRRIRYDLWFDVGDVEEKHHATIVVEPKPYSGRTDLILPLRGRVMVHDGHDLLSHHRRLDITGDMTTALGITENMTRYSYDFVLIDPRGSMHRDDGEENSEWYGFGAPVVAPGSGVVVGAAGDRPDGTQSQRAPMDFAAVMKDLHVIFGNYVVIDHENGEFSVLAHLKQGSVTVKAGDRVKQGAVIGALGSSGDSMFPHLHYQVQRDARTGEGLPSYFRDFRRLTGSAYVKVPRGQVDTGDVVESLR